MSKSYLLQIAAATALALPIAAAYQVEPDPMARDLITRFQKISDDILLLGDSTIRAVAPCEVGPKSIDTWLEKTSGRHIVSIVSAGFDARMFIHYLRAFDRTPAQPQNVVVMINLRSFSQAWSGRPSFMLKEQVAAVDWTVGHSSRIKAGLQSWWATVIRPWEDAHWDRQSVLLGTGEVLGTHEELIHEKIPDLDCHKDEQITLTDGQREALRRRYLFHYGEKISPDHPLIRAYLELATQLSQRKIWTLFYITPVNIDDAERFVDPGLVRTIAENSDLIVNELKVRGFNVLDLHGQLSRDRFIDLRFVCEHVDDSGRHMIATELSTHLH